MEGEFIDPHAAIRNRPVPSDITRIRTDEFYNILIPINTLNSKTNCQKELIASRTSCTKLHDKLILKISLSTVEYHLHQKSTSGVVFTDATLIQADRK